MEDAGYCVDAVMVPCVRESPRGAHKAIVLSPTYRENGTEVIISDVSSG